MSTHSSTQSQHSTRAYFVVWAILLACLFVSIGFGRIPDHRWMYALVFGVAIFKAAMVVIYFMELHLEPWQVITLLVFAVLFLVALWFGVAPDVTYSPTLPHPTPL